MRSRVGLKKRLIDERQVVNTEVNVVLWGGLVDDCVVGKVDSLNYHDTLL